MAVKNPTPDDSGVMLIAVLAILPSRIDAPYAFAGCALVIVVVLVRWLRRRRAPSLMIVPGRHCLWYSMWGGAGAIVESRWAGGRNYRHFFCNVSAR